MRKDSLYFLVGGVSQELVSNHDFPAIPAPLSVDESGVETDYNSYHFWSFHSDSDTLTDEILQDTTEENNTRLATRTTYYRNSDRTRIILAGNRETHSKQDS